MELLLPTQLENRDEIKKVLRLTEVEYTFNDEDITAMLLHLPHKGGNGDVDSLVKLIKDNLMVHFVYSYLHITRTLALDNSIETAKELFKNAIGRISRDTVQGELGDLLLFTTLDVYLNAPKIVSKISIKTNRRIPAHGADAVHAQFVNGELLVYLGEAKMHKTIGSGCNSAIKSILDRTDSYNNEWGLIDNQIDFPGITDEMRKKILNLLNPFNENCIQNLHSPCFVGFTEPPVYGDNEMRHIEKYRKIADNTISNFYKNLISKNAEISKVRIILLPFNSIDDFVERVVSEFGVEK